MRRTRRERVPASCPASRLTSVTIRFCVAYNNTIQFRVHACLLGACLVTTPSDAVLYTVHNCALTCAVLWPALPHLPLPVRRTLACPACVCTSLVLNLGSWFPVPVCSCACACTVPVPVYSIVLLYMHYLFKVIFRIPVCSCHT